MSVRERDGIGEAHREAVPVTLHGRELTGPASAGRKPEVVYRGKSLRYDVYVVTAGVAL